MRSARSLYLVKQFPRLHGWGRFWPVGQGWGLGAPKEEVLWRPVFLERHRFGMDRRLFKVTLERYLHTIGSEIMGPGELSDRDGVCFDREGEVPDA